jgi:hypothetical protein
MRANTVSVSRQYHQTGPSQRRDSFLCGPFSWLGPGRPQGPAADPADGTAADVYVKVRHGAQMYRCRLLQLGSLGEVAAAAAAAGGAASAGQQGREQELDPHHQQQQQQLPGGASREQQPQQLPGAAAGEQPLYGWVVLEGTDQGLAPGQYGVFYQGGACLGAAVILGAPS